MTLRDVRTTDVYRRWHTRLRDRQAKIKIDARISRLQVGNRGDVRPVGRGVSELRIPHGPGYRVYFVERGESVLMLLAGGDKRTQRRDIARAIEMSEQL